MGALCITCKPKYKIPYCGKNEKYQQATTEPESSHADSIDTAYTQFSNCKQYCSAWAGWAHCASPQCQHNHKQQYACKGMSPCCRMLSRQPLQRYTSLTSTVNSLGLPHNINCILRSTKMLGFSLPHKVKAFYQSTRYSLVDWSMSDKPQ